MDLAAANLEPPAIEQKIIRPDDKRVPGFGRARSGRNDEGQRKMQANFRTNRVGFIAMFISTRTPK
jgi:hypothetical protein